MTKKLRFDMLSIGTKFTGLYVGSTARFVKVTTRTAKLDEPNSIAFTVRPATLVTIEVASAMTGADLAGVCEGEQVADMIDLLRKIVDADPSKPSASLDTLKAEATTLLAEIENRFTFGGAR